MLFKQPSLLKASLICLIAFVLGSVGIWYWGGTEISKESQEFVEQLAGKEGSGNKTLLIIDHALADGKITKNELSQIKRIAKKEGRY